MAFAPPKNMTRTEPGHRLVSQGPWTDQWTRSTEALFCSCGETFSLGYPQSDGTYHGYRKDGSVSGYILRKWHGHLDAAVAANTIIEVGTVALTRVTHHYFVMPTTSALDQGWDTKRRWDLASTWAICTTAVTASGRETKRIVRGYHDMQAALTKAEDWLLKAQRDGRTVVFVRESTIKEAPGDVTFRFVELADKALETRSLHDIEEAHQELDKFFKLLPIIEAKRDAVENLRDEILLGAA